MAMACQSSRSRALFFWAATSKPIEPASHTKHYRCKENRGKKAVTDQTSMDAYEKEKNTGHQEDDASV
jgi:hypothetical protein